MQKGDGKERSEDKDRSEGKLESKEGSEMIFEGKQWHRSCL